jgi:hypothetical protein
MKKIIVALALLHTWRSNFELDASDLLRAGNTKGILPNRPLVRATKPSCRG